MKVVKLANHACIRVQKEAIPLRARGHEVHLIAHAIPELFEEYNTFTICKNIEQMKNAVKLHKDADVFHCHNEPSYFVALVKELFPDKPVVLDVHDSYLGRMTQEAWKQEMEKGNMMVRHVAEERLNFALADGLVFPSNNLKDVVVNELGLSQPNMVLYPYVPAKLFKYTMREYLGGLVYEGRVNTLAEIQGSPNMHGFIYCVYEELAKQCDDLQIPLHLHTIRKEKEFTDVYEKYAILHPPMNCTEMLKELVKYDWGLVGNVYKTAEWDVAMPNKLFEYVACGVPVVAINAIECEKYVVEQGIGISVKSIQELADRWFEFKELKKNVIKKRQSLSMDAHIGELEDFYKKVVQ